MVVVVVGGGALVEGVVAGAAGEGEAVGVSRGRHGRNGSIWATVVSEGKRVQRHGVLPVVEILEGACIWALGCIHDREICQPGEPVQMRYLA